MARIFQAMTLLALAMAVVQPLPGAERPAIDAVVLVSADAEWAATKGLFPGVRPERSPFGEYWLEDLSLPDGTSRRVVVFQGGWGKVAAAASAQFVIDRWRPAVVINLGTCGGFQGVVERGDVILAARTVIYDIVERMGNAQEAVDAYVTTLDLGWLVGPDPRGVRRMTLVSADQDVDPAALLALRSRYGAAAADWESGAIAYTARKNGTRVLILRGVTDIVGPRGGEAYGDIGLFRRNTAKVMKRLFAGLPSWLARVR